MDNGLFLFLLNIESINCLCCFLLIVNAKKFLGSIRFFFPIWYIIDKWIFN